MSGSSYTYTYATMGRFMAWFIGWNMVLEYLRLGIHVAVGWSGYFIELCSDEFRHRLSGRLRQSRRIAGDRAWVSTCI